MKCVTTRVASTREGSRPRVLLDDAAAGGGECGADLDLADPLPPYLGRLKLIRISWNASARGRARAHARQAISMPPRRGRELRRSPSRVTRRAVSVRPITAPVVFAATVTAFVVVGVVEWGLLAAGGRVFGAGAGEGLTTLAFIAGLCGLVGVGVGVCLAIVLPPALRILQPRSWARSRLLGREATAEQLVASASWWLAGLAAMLPLMVAAGVGGRVAHGFARGTLAAPFVALAALAGALAALAALFPLRALFGWLIGKLAPTGRVARIPVPWLPFALLALVGAVAFWKVAQLDLGAYRLGGYFALAGGSGLALLILLRPMHALFALPALALAFGGTAWAVYELEDSPVARRVIPLEGHLSATATTLLRKLLDRDGDGASALLAGGDCDDANAAIGPHAREVPGNGVDDNCVGGDAPNVDVATPPPPPPPPEKAEDRYEPKPYNVLFVLIDTLRPDHLGMHGYARPTSPNLDAWAKDAVVFERVWAQAPNTPRSTPSILIGRYPSRIGWDKRFARFSGLTDDNETVFEIFQGGGWRTEVQSAHWYFERAAGIKAGVDHWDNRGHLSISESNTQSAAPKLTPRVVERLETLSRADEPFMLMVHYFDPHSRYMNHKSVRVFGKTLLDKYDSEIAWTDHHLQPVFDALERLKLYEDTVVVVTSDHGEAFKEHGFHFHGRTLYDEETRVPLLVRMPGVPGKRVTQPVVLIDLVPTLAHLVGLQAKQAQGVSLVPLLTGKGEMPAKRTLFMEQLPYPNYEKYISAAMDGRGIKAVRNVTDNVWAVYDLRSDPGEKTNLLDRDPDAAKALRAELAAFIDGDPGK